MKAFLKSYSTSFAAIFCLVTTCYFSNSNASISGSQNFTDSKMFPCATSKIFINSGDGAPVFLDPLPPTFIGISFLCDSVTFSISASDPGSGPVTLTATGLPPSAVMTPSLPATGRPVTSVFRWLPSTSPLDLYVIVFTATDTNGNQTNYTISIDYALSVLSGPVFVTTTCGAVYSIFDTDTLTIPIIAADKPLADVITLTATGIPEGATVTPSLPALGNPLEVIFKWSPSSSQFGDHTITFTAVDRCGLINTCSFLVDVVSPVDLTSFVHSINKNNVILNWTTSSETNNSGFEIERTISGYDAWEKTGYVKGKGNSSVPVSYSFNDRGLRVGNYEYRLKQIDFNGHYEYHILNNGVAVGIPENFELSQNYPNPFNPVTKIDFEIPSDGQVSLDVFDISGRLVSTIVKEFKTAGYYSQIFNAANIASGVYYYKLQYNNETISFEKIRKLVVLK